MKRQLTNIYANVKEDSIHSQEQWSNQSEYDEREHQDQQQQANLSNFLFLKNIFKSSFEIIVNIQVNEIQQQSTDQTSAANVQNSKKSKLPNTSEYKINQNQVKEKFAGLLNAQQLVDDDFSTPRLQQNIKSNVSVGVDTSKSQQAKRSIEEVLGTNRNTKSSFRQLFQGQQSKKQNQHSHSHFGTFQQQDQEVKESISKNENNASTQNRLQQLGLITQQRVQSESDFLKNPKKENKQNNELSMYHKQALNGVFLNSQFSGLQKPQSISSQSKRVSTSQSRSQIDFLRGYTSGGVRPINRGNLLQQQQQQSVFQVSTPLESSKRVKTQAETTYDSESQTQSIFFQTSRQTVSQGSSNSQNNFKFKRVQISSHTQKPSSELKSNNLSDFRNVSHIQQKQKESTQITMQFNFGYISS